MKKDKICAKFMNLSLYHDAKVVGISFQDGNSIEIKFQLTSDKYSCLTIENVSLIRMTDFTDQNIVHRLMVSGNDGYIDDIAFRIKWATSRSDFFNDDLNQKLLNVCQEIERGDRILIYLEPSTGAEMVAICTGYLENTSG